MVISTSLVPWLVLTAGIPAVLIDQWSRRIPNRLVLATLVSAIAFQAFAGGITGAAVGLLGAIVGLVVLLPLYLHGGMGAGDVKLMAAFGALLGPVSAVLAALLTLVSGTFLAMSYLYKRSNRFWHLLIRHRLTAMIWRPLVEANRRRHLKLRRRLATRGGAPGHTSSTVVSAGV